MTKFLVIFLLIALTALFAMAQVKPRPRPAPTPPRMPAKVPAKPASPAATPVVDPDMGTVLGRTFTNGKFGFEVTFPDMWLIPDDLFEDYMKKKGYDLSLKAPDSLTPVGKASVDKALLRVKILLTAYRSMPGSTSNAIVRISAEDLSLEPQIKDAVDYFDALRATFAKMKLPPDFFYSETQAEQLGTKQFAYLDTSSSAGKKRMYTMVRRGFAIMFTISYSNDQDLETLRQVLAAGKFDLK